MLYIIMKDFNDIQQKHNIQTECNKNNKTILWLTNQITKKDIKDININLFDQNNKIVYALNKIYKKNYSKIIEKIVLVKWKSSY